ncbi:hypothetical protein ABKA04_001262 [Annulohypoxylon sp. FPYF3050]
MPGSVAQEAYACTHSQETRRQTLGTDSTSSSTSSRTLTSLLTSPTQCPDCEYSFLLEGYRELEANGYQIIPPPGQGQTPLTDEARVEAFAKYLSDLLEKKRCALLAAYGAGFAPEF